MLRFEPYDVAEWVPVSTDRTKPPLPCHLEPAPEEALISWLSRLAMRLETSVQTFLQTADVTVDRPLESTWRLRPKPNFLAGIGRRTGFDASQLLSMTFAQWQPVIRNDHDILERFYPPRQHFTPRSRRQALQQIVLCAQCLRDDSEPYPRLPWMLGWTALCPRHATVLTGHCPQCQASFRQDQLMTLYVSQCCGHCNAELTRIRPQPAHEIALRLQAALLAGKRDGSSEFANLGMMSWPLATATVETLLALVWTPALSRRPLYRYIRHDFDLGGDFDEWSGRYGDLLLVAWLLDRWPRNLRVCRGLLPRPLPGTSLQCRPDLHPDIRAQLRGIFQPVSYPWRRRHARRPSWRSWLDHLPLTGEELRARAHRERLQHRRLRLIALAGLRDGRSVNTVAAAVRVRPETICDWLHAGATNGLEALLERRLGRQLLGSAQMAEIAEWLACRPAPGAPGFRVIRAADVITESRVRFGVQITHAVANALLRRHCKSRRWRRPPLHPLGALSSRIMEPVQN